MLLPASGKSLLLRWIAKLMVRRAPRASYTGLFPEPAAEPAAASANVKCYFIPHSKNAIKWLLPIRIEMWKCVGVGFASRLKFAIKIM